jgi:hypothetical protein
MTIDLSLPSPPARLHTITGGGTLSAPYLHWEEAQEAGIRAFHAEDAGEVERAWHRSLDIARRHFGGSDPCLASSLTNYGFAERRLGRVKEGTDALREALGVWDRGWRRLDQASSATASNRHPAPVCRCLDQLMRQGYATSLRILNEDDPPTGRFELWLPLRSVRRSELRRLLAAVLLIVSWPAAEAASSAARLSPDV